MKLDTVADIAKAAEERGFASLTSAARYMQNVCGIYLDPVNMRAYEANKGAPSGPMRAAWGMFFAFHDIEMGVS